MMLEIFGQKKRQYIDFPFIKLNYEKLKKCFFYNFLRYPTPLKNREFPKRPITFLLAFIFKNEVQIRNQQPQIHQNSYITRQVPDSPLQFCSVLNKLHLKDVQFLDMMLDAKGQFMIKPALLFTIRLPQNIEI